MNTTQTAAATPAKLRNGSWGARTSATVSEGDIVTITTRAGKSWDARVTRVVWSGGDVAICATESIDRPSQRRAPSGCSHCRQTATRSTQIWEDCDYCGTEPIYI